MGDTTTVAVGGTGIDGGVGISAVDDETLGVGLARAGDAGAVVAAVGVGAVEGERAGFAASRPAS